MALNYAVKENVLCFHGPLIYEAQVSELSLLSHGEP